MKPPGPATGVKRYQPPKNRKPVITEAGWPEEAAASPATHGQPDHCDFCGWSPAWTAKPHDQFVTENTSCTPHEIQS